MLTKSDFTLAVPKEPDKDAVLSVNSTSATFTFSSWPTQLCPIMSFTCQYIAHGNNGGGVWVKFPKQNLAGDTFTVSHLQPASIYTVRVFVYTEAGDTSWEHTFATHTESGGECLPIDLFKTITGGGGYAFISIT